MLQSSLPAHAALERRQQRAAAQETIAGHGQAASFEEPGRA
jgi:hypothetical protein